MIPSYDIYYDIHGNFCFITGEGVLNGALPGREAAEWQPITLLQVLVLNFYSEGRLGSYLIELLLRKLVRHLV